MDEIEIIFISDCREKKRIASNIHKRASRLGFIRGGVRTQYDYMSSKERKKLNGVVKVSNMYENPSNLPSYKELVSMEFDDAKRILGIAKSKFTNNQLIKHWSISTGKLYNTFEKYGLHKRNEGSKPRRINKEKEISKKGQQELALDLSSGDLSDKVIKEDVDIKALMEEMKRDLIESLKQKEVPEEVKSGFRIEFSGEYDKQDVESRLLSIGSVMVDNKRYKIKIELEEI